MTDAAAEIPAPIRRAGDMTSAQMLAGAARRWPRNTALLLDGQRLSWSALHDEARLWARALMAAGVGPGAHVAVLMPNSVDYVRLFYAAGMIGACTVTLNARFRGPELAFAIAHSDADLLVIGGHALPHRDYRAMLTAIYPALADWAGGPLTLEDAPRLTAVFNLADPREEAWPTGETLLAGAARVSDAELDAAIAAVSPDSTALMMYSSGTTAHPKACLLPHRSVNMVGAAFAERFGLGPDDRIMNPLPFFHMSTMLPMAACRASGAAQLATQHFRPGAALDVMEGEGATFGYLSFPTLMNQLIGHDSFATRDLSPLRFFHCVGPAELMQKYRAALPQAQYINAYGLTEATGVPVYTDPADPPGAAVSVSGRPFPGVRAKTVDPETLADLPPGARGEIWLSGWCLFDGYYKDDAATAAAMRPDGWLRTGDMGWVDSEGRVTFDGRLKDMLKIGGENVAALEIETVLCAHPDVQAAQVIPVSDDHLVEVAAAFVEPTPGAALTPADVVAFCAGRLARYKVPRYVRFVSDWPMSATKIQKFRLPRDFTAAERIEPDAGA